MSRHFSLRGTLAAFMAAGLALAMWGMTSPAHATTTALASAPAALNEPVCGEQQICCETQECCDCPPTSTPDPCDVQQPQAARPRFDPCATPTPTPRATPTATPDPSPSPTGQVEAVTVPNTGTPQGDATPIAVGLLLVLAGIGVVLLTPRRRDDA